MLEKSFAERTGRSLNLSEQQQKPEENVYINWYKRAFYTISRSRQAVMGIGYIPLSAIVDYSNNVGHVEDTVQDFIEIIYAMDDIYVAHHVNKK